MLSSGQTSSKKYKNPRTLGLLLYGAAGTGKTAIVRALAGEAKINLVIGKIHEIVDMYTGNTEKNLHNLFEEARKNAPSILFIDELDGLGTKRSGLGNEGTAAVMRLAINTFLQEMDGLDSNKDNLFVIGASNQPWAIDEALKRSGRFETTIYIRPPNYKERKQMFKYYLAGKPLGRINYDRLSRATMGYSGADIKKICGEATIRAIKADSLTNKSQIITTAKGYSWSCSIRSWEGLTWMNGLQTQRRSC